MGGSDERGEHTHTALLLFAQAPPVPAREAIPKTQSPRPPLPRREHTRSTHPWPGNMLTVRTEPSPGRWACMIFLALRSGLWPWGMLTVDSSARGVRANMALRRVKEASIFSRSFFFPLASNRSDHDCWAESHRARVTSSQESRRPRRTGSGAVRNAWARALDRNTKKNKKKKRKRKSVPLQTNRTRKGRATGAAAADPRGLRCSRHHISAGRPPPRPRT